MRLVSYGSKASWSAGIVLEDDVIDLNEALSATGDFHGQSFGSVREFLEAAGGRLEDVATAIDRAAIHSTLPVVGSVSSVRLGPPVPDPSKVLCIGLNYADHVGETGRQLPSHPDVFSKFDTSLIGPTDVIAGTDITENLDFEGELAIVIGRVCSRVDESEALGYVAGLTVLNDITARDLQHRGTQWLAGKALDDATPCGPFLVTLDEVGDPQTLDIRTTVNGVEVQSSNTKNMIFSVANVVAYVSQFLTLRPGDIIATGTPEGIGAKRQPPQWLQVGDVVTVELERVGVLTNRVG
ncbi:5-oxopent-3-ene-1,2,5-tricarboxylate decarboxylase [Aeromicrobium sp. Root236]|uniref:fumarylacetoacetate hydrolase family protein n=1 Tax=Aeromicrobium sp. Root236 TaxID=1736498 RepID=UPI0006F793C7|nr:fumarylacetoacetate hydrolase family protein [Aeromicrobium sp. Root236]KRC65806.1 5-oxopent-3-ene-1,2,5-tricarboxylate decarboxylase [Aeromicrobium sp. Root236]